MDLFVNTFHVVLCVVLILVILLQPSKGSDIGAAFGGGGSNTMFGPRGAGNMLSKATTVVAILFMVTSISLAVRSTPQFTAGTSLGDDILGGGLQELDFGDINEEPLSDFPELDQLLNNVDGPNDTTGEAPETAGEVAGDATDEEATEEGTTEEEVEVSTDDVDAGDLPTQE